MVASVVTVALIIESLEEKGIRGKGEYWRVNFNDTRCRKGRRKGKWILGSKAMDERNAGKRPWNFK